MERCLLPGAFTGLHRLSRRQRRRLDYDDLLVAREPGENLDLIAAADSELEGPPDDLTALDTMAEGFVLGAHDCGDALDEQDAGRKIVWFYE